MSVRKREWRGGEAFVVDLQLGGKRHRKQFPTRREAREYELDVKQKSRTGKFNADAAKITLRSLRDEYFEVLDARYRRGKRMTRSYLAGTKASINNYLIGGVPIRRNGGTVTFEDGLGDVRLSELCSDVFEEFYDEILDSGLTKKTAKEIKNTASVMIEWVWKKKGLLHSNPAREAALVDDRNAKAKRKITVPPKNLIRRMVDAADGWFRLYLLVAALSGLRAGEQRALRWRDISWNRGEILVRSRVDRWGAEDGQGTKTEAGNRDVPISEELLKDLRKWREETSFSALDDFIFANPGGRVLNHTNIRQRYYFPLYERVVSEWPSGEPVPPRPRWHDLRHFAASCWIEAGLPPLAIQQFIGHASVSTTMNIYGHLFPSEAHNQAMDRIAKALLSSNGEVDGERHK